MEAAVNVVSFPGGWLLLSLLYLGSGVWTAVLWRDQLHDAVWLALFLMGGVIFLAVNNEYAALVGSAGVEITVISLLALVWLLTIIGIRAWVADQEVLDAL